MSYLKNKKNINTSTFLSTDFTIPTSPQRFNIHRNLPNSSLLYSVTKSSFCDSELEVRLDKGQIKSIPSWHKRFLTIV